MKIGGRPEGRGRFCMQIIGDDTGSKAGPQFHQMLSAEEKQVKGPSTLSLHCFLQLHLNLKWSQNKTFR